MNDSAAGNSAFAKAHQALLQQADFQFVLPKFQQPKPPEWIGALDRFLRAHEEAAKWGLWIVAGVIVAIILVTLLRQYWPLLTRRTSKPPPREETEPEWRPTVVQARRLLQDSDALAAKGQYSEAVHLILLRSIEDIEEKRPRAVRRAFTSREIGRLQALPESARMAFDSIARVVERALFAGERIGATEFTHCREKYESFAFAPSWQEVR